MSTPVFLACIYHYVTSDIGPDDPFPEPLKDFIGGSATAFVTGVILLLRRYGFAGSYLPGIGVAAANIVVVASRHEHAPT